MGIAGAGTGLGGGFRRMLFAVCVVLSGLLGVHPAWGHGLHFPKRDTLRIDTTKITLTVRLDFDDEESLSICDRFDRNSDERVGDDEREAMSRYLVGEARRPIELQLDGHRLALEVSSKVVQGCDAKAHGESRLGVDVVLEAALPEQVGERHFELGDALSHAEDEVPVRVELKGLRSTASSEGRWEKSTAGDEVLRGVYVRRGEFLRFSVEPRVEGGSTLPAE